MKLIGIFPVLTSLAVASVVASCGLLKKDDESRDPKQTDAPVVTATNIPVDPPVNKDFPVAFSKIDDSNIYRVMCVEDGSNCDESTKKTIAVAKFFEALRTHLAVDSLTTKLDAQSASLKNAKESIVVLKKEQSDADNAPGRISQINRSLIPVDAAITDIKQQISIIDASLAANSNQPALVALRASYTNDLRTKTTTKETLSSEKQALEALIQRQDARDIELAAAIARRDSAQNSQDKFYSDLQVTQNELENAKRSLPELLVAEKAVSSLANYLWFEEVFAAAQKI